MMINNEQLCKSYLAKGVNEQCFGVNESIETVWVGQWTVLGLSRPEVYCSWQCVRPGGLAQHHLTSCWAK